MIPPETDLEEDSHPLPPGISPLNVTGGALLAAIVESSEDAIISKDLNGIVLSWNRAAERIFGYTAEEAIGRHISFLAVRERLEEIPNILDRIRRGERVDHFETKRQTKDGRVLSISLTVSPVRNAAGEIVGASKIARDVTERKRLESALDAQTRSLADREQYLQVVLESIPECIKVLGEDGKICELNKAGLDMIGADSAGQLIGTCFYSLVAERDRDGFRHLNESVFRGGPGGTIEFALTTLKGSERIFEARLAPLRDGLNNVIGALSAARDITDRKRIERAVQRSEARFRAAAQAVSSLIWTSNAQGEMFGIQPAWSRFTGQNEAQYAGLGWISAVHPDDVQRTIAEWRAAIAGRKMFVIEHRVRSQDGAYRLFFARAVPVFDAFGELTEWVGVHADITEERQWMAERVTALEREQKARYTAEILNRIGPLLAVELDTEALTQKVTDLATQLVGAEFGALFHNVEDSHGESYLLYTISGVPREQFSKFPMPRNTAVFAPTFSGQGIVRSPDITKDPRYGHNAPHFGMPEGHLPVRSYLAAPVMSRSGEVLGGLFFGHQDVAVFTKEHEELVAGIAAQAAIALDNARLFAQSQAAREELARSNDHLRRANADLEQFAYSASHDLKEPLRHIAVYNQILQRRYHGKLDAQADEFIRISVDSARRMEDLVSGLLAYTQAASGDQDGSETVDANAVLEKALENLRTAICETQAQVTHDHLPALNVHELHLVQLFQNLAGNALKYHGDTPPRIHVSATRDASMWRLCVADNGIGIEPEYVERIFGLFKRLHGSEAYSGTGIGLALCQKIVQRYGGRIWVESEGPGKGSQFCFTLPGAQG